MNDDYSKMSQEEIVGIANKAIRTNNKPLWNKITKYLAEIGIAVMIASAARKSGEISFENKVVNETMYESLSGANYEAIVDDYINNYPQLFETKNKYKAFVAYELMEKGYDEAVVYHGLGFADKTDMLRKAGYFQDLYENSAAFTSLGKPIPVDSEEWIRSCKNAEKIVKCEIKDELENSIDEAYEARFR